MAAGDNEQANQQLLSDLTSAIDFYDDKAFMMSSGGGSGGLDMPLPEMIRELGYQFTAKPEICRSHLLQLSGGNELHASTVARMTAIMVRTHTGLDDSTTLQNLNATGTSLWDKDKSSEPKTWNMEVFIQVVHELQPTLHWKEILYELDHPGFVVKDRQGLILLMKALKLGFQMQGFAQTPFPVDMLYRPWKNAEGQVSLFQQILRNPDIFNFDDHQHHPVAVEVLKVPPDDNREFASWRSLELLDTLLMLAESGHPADVLEMFQLPKAHCPDVLMLGLMQINPPLTGFRTEVLAQLLQVFLGPHPNSTVILNYAWHSNMNLKGIVFLSMSEWYAKSTSEGDTEHARLSRILDIAQDLKALSILLTAKTTPFVIDLAVMASRREYLNLEKWLTDQLQAQGETFVKAVAQHFQRKLPPLAAPWNQGALKEEHFAKVNFPIEAFASMMFFIQQCAQHSSIQPDLKEIVGNMVQVSQALLNRHPLLPASSRGGPPSSSGGGLVPRGPRAIESSSPMSSFNPVGVGPTGSSSSPIVRPMPRPAPQTLPPQQQPHDALLGITSQFGGLGFGSTSSGGGSFNLGPLVSGPGSPNRMFGSGGPQGGPPPLLESGLGGGSPSPFSGSSGSGLLPPPPHPPPGVATASSGQSTAVSQSPMEQVRQGGGGGGGGLAHIFPDSNEPVPHDLEDEANSYFMRIFNHPPHPTLTIDEVLELLKKFQESTIQRERDLFQCMIKNLFEEYKYFPQYPVKELHIIAQLFGGIIEHGLVTMVPLGIALRFVLDAMRKPVDTNMYYFGVTALDRFKTRLKDYPQYCQHISCIEHFRQFPAHLIEWVEFGMQSTIPTNKPQGPVLPPHLDVLIKGGSGNAVSSSSTPGITTSSSWSLPSSVGTVAISTRTTTTTTTVTSSTVSTLNAIVRPSTVSGRPSIANTTNIDTLLNAKQKSGTLEQPKAPSEKLQEKVAFIFNNLSLMNMKQKADDLKDVLGNESDYSSWLAQYLVMKRASIEPNFHNLYSSFLEALKNDTLYKEVLKETYTNIRILLGSDKGIANFSDRSLLKNLGHWLGLMTLGRDKPILMVDLEVKPLIIEAFHNGQQELLYVVPFVAKVLDSCAKSKVFKPPCPWTMGIMNLLAELHQEHDLKLNLKFEIEVLCKTLSLELSSLQPSSLLKDYDKLNKMLNLTSFGMNARPGMSAGLQHGMAQGMGGKNLDPFSMSMSSPHGARSSGGMTAMAGGGGPVGSAAGSLAAHSLNLDMGLPMSSMPPIIHGGFGGNVGLGGSSVGLGPSGGLPFVGTSSAPPPLPDSTPMGLDQFSQAAILPPQVPPPSTSATSATAAPREPKFSFSDINTSSLNGIVPHITIDPRLTLLKDQPELVQLIKLAIEKAIQEWLTVIIERSVKIAYTTGEQLIKKDFALDPDENRMRMAAHHMVRNLTAGMTMITCRDHLMVSIKTNLKNFMLSLGRNLSQSQQESIEMTVSVIANDNVDLACAFLQKKAIEKVIPEIDKKLKSEYESRMQARKEGRRYFDPVALTYQAERMPEAIRLKVGSVSAQQSAVYEEFARNIPGLKPLTDRELTSVAPKPLIAPLPSSSTATTPTAASTALATTPTAPAAPAPVVATSEECVAILDEIITKVDQFVQNCTTLPERPHMVSLRALLEGMNVARTNKEPASALALVQRSVENLLSGLTPQPNQGQPEVEALARYRDANLLILRALSDPRAYGQNWVNSKVSQALSEARDEIKYNLDAFDALVRSNLLNLFEYDKHLATAMAGGENSIATSFAMHVCRIYLIDDRTNAHIIESDLFGTIEALQKIVTQTTHPPEGMANLVEMIKMSSERLEQNLAMTGPTAQLHSGIAQAKEFEDPPGLLEKTEYLLREWVNAYHARDAGKDSRQAFVIFVQLMNQHGILKTDDLITRFFRMSTQMCVDLCYRALNEPNNSPTLVRAKCFHTLDAYVRLITLLVKHSGETANTVTKVNLLNKVLGIVAGVLLIDHDVRGFEFQQVPYHRIFIMLFLELNAPDPILENINFQVLNAYCNMLHILRPVKATGFAYAWLEIVSHRVFLGRILASTPQQKGWPMFAQLMVDLFKFLSPFLRNAELAKPVHRLYRGTLRVLLVLLHDFPEFLCDFHYSFCDVIPPNCVQMRNLILSAFPRNMRLPDPFTPNLKVELLHELSMAPRTMANYTATIKPGFKKDLDSYLKNRSPVSFLSEIRNNVVLGASETPGNRYNIPMINALVMYVGTSAIQYIRSQGQTPNMQTIAHWSHMDIFQNLAADLDTEGRYLFLNCIANQLRYPNSHTHYFSCTLLYLFAEANTETIQEQITRVLLERLIVNRPHPWGLLITFIELIKNPLFNFWNHEFVTCAPEIQKLFESVARSCVVAVPSRINNEHD